MEETKVITYSNALNDLIEYFKNEDIEVELLENFYEYILNKKIYIEGE
mgnify:CR=1